MSGASTGRLILEGVVESVKIYRGHKQDRARAVKVKEEEDRKRGEKKSRPRNGGDRSHKRSDSRRREYRNGSRRDGSRDGDGERRRRRVRHRSADGRDRHGQRQSRRHSGNRDEREHRRRHRSRPREGRGPGGSQDDRQLNQPQQQRNRSEHRDEPGPSSGQPMMSGALNTAEEIEEQLFGPDGTPFGSLPTRAKGVGLLAHTTTVYRHIKAEQGAGHRSKGFVEDYVGKLLEKTARGKIAVYGTPEEEELMIKKIRRSRGTRGGREQRQHKPGSGKEGEGQTVGGQPIYEPLERAEPSQPRGLVQQPTPFAQQPPRSVPSTRRNNLDDDHRASAPDLEREEVGANQSSRGAGEAPSVRSQAPVSRQSIEASRVPTPWTREAPSVRDVEDTGVSRNTNRHPTIRVQLPTPPKQASSVHSYTPSVQVTPFRVRSPEFELQEPAISVRDPAPTQLDASLPSMSTPPLPLAKPSPVTPSMIKVSSSATHVASPVPPLPPTLLPPPVGVPTGIWSNFDPARDAFLSSIELGVKLKKVSDRDNSDTSAARKDEARVEDVTRQTPVYEETPHSHNVEALEHAQAVEEMESREEEERNTRALTPVVAPYPQTNMSTNVQDELTAKLEMIHLSKQRNGASKAGPSEPVNVISPRASSETWRTVFSDNEQHSKPDQAFRERLGNTLSGGTPQASTTEIIHGQVTAREMTPAPDVFVDLSAEIASPGWQCRPSWGFDSVPKEGSN